MTGIGTISAFCLVKMFGFSPCVLCQYVKTVWFLSTGVNNAVEKKIILFFDHAVIVNNF